jgi:hypothetical protein
MTDMGSVDLSSEAGGEARRSAPRRLFLSIEAPGLREALAGGDTVVRIIVEDVGTADSLATRLFTGVADALDMAAGGTRARVSITLPALAEAARPAVRVHVDRGASGQITVGDLINPTIVDLPPDDRDVSVPLVTVR